MTKKTSSNTYRLDTESFLETIRAIESVEPSILLLWKVKAGCTGEQLLNAASAIVESLYHASHPYQPYRITGRVIVPSGVLDWQSAGYDEFALAVAGLSEQDAIEVVRRAVRHACEDERLTSLPASSSCLTISAEDATLFFCSICEDLASDTPIDYDICDCQMSLLHFDRHGIELGYAGEFAKFLGVSPTIDCTY